jgi:hypothetical protein
MSTTRTGSPRVWTSTRTGPDEADDPEDAGAGGEHLVDLAGELGLVLAGVGVLDGEGRGGAHPGGAGADADGEVRGAEVAAVVEAEAGVDADGAVDGGVGGEDTAALEVGAGVTLTGGHAADGVAVAELVGGSAARKVRGAALDVGGDALLRVVAGEQALLQLALEGEAVLQAELGAGLAGAFN